ncbi:hypothetical protein Ciccas_008435 [Cichlidogyrus casuarinus]|uniref:Uncharacterized protein n=1 Tax=Cichlidogyrus casuarinus TaxID=1844966 RepID=A0ABD2PZY0_9PLAT
MFQAALLLYYTFILSGAWAKHYKIGAIFQRNEEGSLEFEAFRQHKYQQLPSFNYDVAFLSSEIQLIDDYANSFSVAAANRKPEKEF